MSNTNRDYLIICDVKNSKLTISRPIKFYVTDKNTSNIFIRLVTQIAYDSNINKYVDIEPASNFAVTMRIVKPNNETKSVTASKLEEGAMYQVDLQDDCKDVQGTYKCELLISTSVHGRQELNTSDMFTYKVERSVLSNVDEIVETEDTTVEDILNRVDAVNLRIDNLIRLEEGSTTGDAELIDARVGIDGITYPNLGQALRTQLGNVGISPYVALPFELTPNQYINYNNGSITTHDSSAYMASNFIRLIGIGDITIKNLHYHQFNNAGLAFYDNNKNYIQGYQYNYDEDLTLSIPKGASYLRFTYFEGVGETRNNVIVHQRMYDIMHLFNDDINQLKQEIEECIITESLVYELILKEGYYISFHNGAETVYGQNNFCASDFVELNKQHAKLYVDNLNYPFNDNGGLAFYDANKKFIEGYRYNKASNLCLDLPSNACYVRLTTLTNSPVTVYSKSVLRDVVNKNSEQIKNLEETISTLSPTDNYDYCQIFHKIAGIGDSLMSGELVFWNEEEQKNNYIDLYKYSWLSNLCKNIGAEPVHYSSGGRTTKTWLSGYLDKLKTETVKPSAYFIALGTNDAVHVELGTVEDCDTDNETFYGMYSKIIREVQQFNPHAKVFCFSLYFKPSDKTVQNYCNAIKTMSERYGCYYVDFINTYGHFYTNNKDFISVGHFTAPGYVRVGKEMQILVNDIIRKNQNDFKFIGLNYKDI